MENEIWKPVIVKGFEGLYFISNHGRLRNKNNRLKKSFRLREKYLTVILNKNSKQTSFILKNLVAFHFIPNPQRLKTVYNIDGDIYNNRVSNLRWGDLPDVWNKGLKESPLTLNQIFLNTIRQNGGRQRLLEFMLKKEAPIQQKMEPMEPPSDRNFFAQYFERETNYCNCEVLKILEK